MLLEKYYQPLLQQLDGDNTCNMESKKSNQTITASRLSEQDIKFSFMTFPTL